MIEIQSPHPWTGCASPKIFLGGSIEMGLAANWQEQLKSELVEYDVVLLNPRRSDWDVNWVQSIDNAPFNEQVNWELNALDAANTIIFYFDPKTKSPITLMELGLFAESGKVVVCCPPGFWRKGNVDIVCDRHNILMLNTFSELISYIKDQYKHAYFPRS